jgi:rhamnosyltransferase
MNQNLIKKFKFMSPSIGILIPTFQAIHHLPHCLPPLLKSPLKPKILIIDSSSTDGTVEYARNLGVEVLVIPQQEFNHGLTREKGRKQLNTSIVVMLTQDAYAMSIDMLNDLVEPLVKQEVSVAYARQVPHQGADIFATFSRQFNYPPSSHQRSLKDVDHWGSYTFFCSNSCAAYCNKALDEIGGFPAVLFGEDTVVVAQLLRQGHRIAYVAEAAVHHSHSYTLKQEFKRHFDMGLARQTYQELLAIQGQDTSRGKHYVKSLLKTVAQKDPIKIPYAIIQSLIKFCGYRLGRMSEQAPIGFKKICSSQKKYWKQS